MNIRLENDEFGSFTFDALPVDVVLPVGGDGLWSKIAGRKAVRLTGLYVHGMNYAEDGEPEHLGGELRVPFDTRTWSRADDGLIYTDKTFLAGLKRYLSTLLTESAAEDIGYSECGMQGEDFVSLDVGSEFIDAWKRLEAPRQRPDGERA